MNIISETVAWLTDPVNWSGPNGIPVRLAEHVGISLVSLLIAIAIALPIGLWIGHTGRGVSLAINSSIIWRALPSIAVIAIVLPITAAIDPQAGFKVYPAVIAMVVLAVPPILVNAYSGISGVDRDLIEAGRGLGLTERQLLTSRRAAPFGGRDPDRHPIRNGADPGHRDPCARSSASAASGATWSTALPSATSARSSAAPCSWRRW